MRELYACHCKSAKATGFPSSGGFTVCKGSVISEAVTGSFELANRWYYQLRNQLIADGTIQDRVFQCDYEFKSKAAAASVIFGRISGGDKSWHPLLTNYEED